MAADFDLAALIAAAEPPPMAADDSAAPRGAKATFDPLAPLPDLHFAPKRVDIRGAEPLELAERPPLGRVWDSGLLLAQYLAEHPPTGRAVLELGSGTGLAGLAAARLGAASVVLTDRSHMCPLLESNAAANGLADVAVARALPWGERPSAALDGAPWPPDLLLASDVLFSPEGHAPLAATVRHLLATLAPCELLLAHERRAVHESEIFAEHLAGLSIEEIDVSGLPAAGESEGVYRVTP